MSPNNITDHRVVVRVPADHDDVRTAASGGDATVIGVGRTGIPDLEPLVTVTIEGRTALYPNCPPDQAADIATDIADSTLDDGAAVIEHDPDTTSFPAAAVRGLDVGTRRVLGGCGWRRPASAADHEAERGFVDVSPNDVLDAAETLRGRGWGDWHHDDRVADDWRQLQDNEHPTAVVVNAHGTAADGLLLESAPLEVLEGAQLAAQVVGAEDIVVYVSEDDERAVARTRKAADAYPDPVAPVAVVTGPSTYRAAEPTMALEAIEGNHRLEARLRPPGSSAPTLHETPALVHTARTLAQLAVAVRSGAPPSTRLVTVSGDVESPTTVELLETDRLADALVAVTLVDGFKAACVGGRFGGLTPSLDITADLDALADADLGTEGTVEVLGETRCVLEFIGKRTQFAEETNCGRCVPCREGATQLTELLRDIYDGDYDVAGIEELIRVMNTSSVCEFGVVAGRPARTTIDAFDAEVAAHADGRCPTGTCFDAPEVTH